MEVCFNFDPIPSFQSANELPIDGSILIAFISEDTNGNPISFAGTPVDRMLVQFAGGQAGGGGLPSGWRGT